MVVRAEATKRTDIFCPLHLNSYTADSNGKLTLSNSLIISSAAKFL